MTRIDAELTALTARIERAIKDAFDAGCTDAQIARAAADGVRTYGLRARIKPEYDWRNDVRSIGERMCDADRDRDWDGR